MNESCLGWIINSLFLPFFFSLLSAGLFWWFSFKRPSTKVIFSNKLEHSLVDGTYRTRFQLANIGRQDLIDVELLAIFEMVSEPIIARRYAILRAGDFNKLPLLKGRKSAAPFWRMYKVDLYIDDITCMEFRRKQYPKSIQTKANDGCLTLEDLFDQYGDKAHVQIYVSGTDNLTGARRTYTSPVYKRSDIVDGTFNKKYDYSSKSELERYISKIE